jgi:hypothetical protein
VKAGISHKINKSATITEDDRRFEWKHNDPNFGLRYKFLIFDFKGEKSHYFLNHMFFFSWLWPINYLIFRRKSRHQSVI